MNKNRRTWYLRYFLRNVRVTYKGADRISIRITPTANGVRVSAAPGHWHKHEDNEHFWEVFVPKETAVDVSATLKK